MQQLLPALALLLAPTAAAQVFVDSPGNLPGSGPANNSATFAVALADVDLDGDWDAFSGNGADVVDQQNQLWMNAGGLQGGTLGIFADETALRLPNVADRTRDAVFVDYDGDGDPDLYTVNTSQFSNQPSRFWTNVGGLQGGSPGYYLDQTATRWVGLGGPGSSIAPSLVLGGGGYASRNEAQAFADLDGDGDLDLIAAAFGLGGTGKEPMRLFLNDGLGHFSEFNPSGFQLAGT
ncbi:MAG TPA: VCBS repeat-containing protein, partial [Planctomycetota bacterium]|nr:VCBS repeat-containing protein [Planctomycetota bacterium]